MKAKIQEHKVPLIVGTLCFIVVLLYLYRDKLADFFLSRQNASNSPVNTGAVGNIVSNGSNSNSNSSSAMNNDTVLKKGDRGDKVGELQVLLNKGLVKSNLSYAALVVDKSFGSKTESILYLLTGKKRIAINELNQLLN